MKYLIIDNRMRVCEKEFLQNLGYKLVEIESSDNIYPEISAHVDIFCAKIGDSLIAEKSKYKKIKNEISTEKVEIIERRKFCREKIS